MKGFQGHVVQVPSPQRRPPHLLCDHILSQSCEDLDPSIILSLYFHCLLDYWLFPIGIQITQD